jgi:Uma2 family endonuclease
MLDHMPVDVDKRRITVDEYQQMGEAGVFSDTDRVELIDGEILTMSPIGSPHCAAVDRAAQAFFRATGARAIVRVQGPIDLNRYTEPEPDLVLLRPRGDFYRSGHPHPADVLLVVEIADASLRFDREVKVPLYARAGVVEYWLVDLNAQKVTRYSAPENGTYREVSSHERGQVLSPSALPDCAIPVAELLNEPSEQA